MKGIYVRLVGWLMVFAALFALGFSVRVMGSASEATAASGLSGVVVSLIVLAVGSFLVVRFRTSWRMFSDLLLTLSPTARDALRHIFGPSSAPVRNDSRTFTRRVLP